MKKLSLITFFLALAMAFSIPTMAGAQVSVNIGLPLPPPIMFPAPPNVIVLPDTDNVYVAPDIDVDLYFWNGFWWRLWDGRWYRSPYYNRGWAFYSGIPIFFFDVDPGWRGYYRSHNWYGHRWDYRRIPNNDLRRNWQSWQNDRRWERRGTWGVQDYHPQPQQQRQQLRQQREQQYRQRPEIQREQQRPQRQDRRDDRRDDGRPDDRQR